MKAKPFQRSRQWLQFRNPKLDFDFLGHAEILNRRDAESAEKRGEWLVSIAMAPPQGLKQDGLRIALEPVRTARGGQSVGFLGALGVSAVKVLCAETSTDRR